MANQVAHANHLAPAGHLILHLQIYSYPLKWQFETPTDRSLLWEFRQIKWTGQVADLHPPPSRGILWPRVELTWAQLTWAQMGSHTGPADHLASADHLTLHLQIYPLFKQWFHRFLLWQLIFYSYSDSSYAAHQVLADLLLPFRGISWPRVDLTLVQ